MLPIQVYTSIHATHVHTPLEDTDPPGVGLCFLSFTAVSFLCVSESESILNNFTNY